MKDTCFEFVINVSWQGEDKIEFKNKFSEIAVLISFFCKINENTQGIYLVLSRQIHNPVKQIISNFLQK